MVIPVEVINLNSETGITISLELLFPTTSTIRTSISLIVDVVGKSNSNEMVIPVEVINLNSETGDEMDAKRLSECMLIVNNY